jgi:two-component system, OmpR family, response regulator
MTVTPLSRRDHRTPSSANTLGRRRRRVTAGTESSALTISFELTLTGDSRYSDTLKILDALRLVTDELDGATLEIAPTAGDDDVPALRALPQAPDPAKSRAIQILTSSRTVFVAGAQISLTRVEFDLLAFLAEHPRRVFDRPQLLQNVWGYQHTGLRTVDVHIRRLRAKLGDALVTTVRSVGYRLADKADVHIHRLP